MKQLKIKDIGNVITGKTPPTKQKRFFGEGYPFITPSDIPSFDIRYLEYCERSLTKDWHSTQPRYLLPVNTICYVCIGSTVGKMCMTREPSFSNQQINSIVCNNEYNPFYVFYKLKTETPKIQSIANGRGAGKPIINKSGFEDLDIEVHDTLSQEKIVILLSVYDRLIENNRRRINILEKMTRTIYDEWFVKFRFPGYSKVRIVDFKGLKVPEGWDVNQINELAEIFRGNSYRSKDLTDGEGQPFLNLKNIRRYGGYRPDGLKWYSGTFKESHTAKARDILIAVTDMTQERMIVSRAALVPQFEFENYVFSMDLVKVQPKEEDNRGFLSGTLLYSSFGDKVKQYANGANVLHLSPDRIAEYHLVVPPLELRKQYADIFNNIYSLIDVLRAKNRNLAQSKDILLPKLFSGEIDVEDMDIDIGELDDR